MEERERNTNTGGHLIQAVAPGSIAEELEIKPGDRLLSIDGHSIEDALDYRFYINSESINMLILKENGEEWELEIEHDYEDLGIEFDSGLMSEYRSCTNKCVFCFIDQMPPGMRETLYFKDDDSRLSFLQGNYITLTNMSERDIDRIIEFKLAPINISIHTTNPKLRVRMLHNRFAGSALRYLDKLYENNIPMNGQIVMCKGYNDKEELERTLGDLMKYLPVMESVSVVPVGVTKYRDKLARLELIDKESAIETIEIIERYQKLAMEKAGMHFIHASDEFYLLAEKELPEEERYDGYIQLGNGVGMLRLLKEEVRDALENPGRKKKAGRLPKGKKRSGKRREKTQISIATGKLPYSVLRELASEIEKTHPHIKIHLYPIRNEFFGESITVTGLLTGRDIIAQLKGRELGERLLLSINMFRSNEEVLLDDLSRSDIEEQLGVRVVIVGNSGYDLVNAVLDANYSAESGYQGYEPQSTGKSKVEEEEDE
ncbi:MAG: DUF512 domain-containing protein [Johnsonella sp.]|nr:DUF512 domain-containing protein [Johnsonella sp.]